MPLVRPYQCLQCGANQFEMARERCGNPGWHDIPRPVPQSDEIDAKVLATKGANPLARIDPNHQEITAP